MLVITGLSLVGALLIQVPEEVAADPSLYTLWLDNVARPEVGGWTGVLSSLRLFDVSHSPWFWIAGLLLVANIMVCSLNRWNRLRAAAIGGPVKQADAFYLSTGEQLSSRLSPSAVSKVSSGVLRRSHYRVRTDGAAGKMYLAADKNRYSMFGSYLGHLSLVLLILGFLVGSWAGFRETSLVVSEGSVQEVGHATGLSLRLESFVDEYYPDGVPKDYRSQVVVYQDGQEVERGIVRVNHPLSYNGVRFYQSYFGPAARVRVTGAAGDVLYEDCVALSGAVTSMNLERPVGGFSLPGSYDVYLIASARSGGDAMIGDGELAVQMYQADSQGSMKGVASGMLSVGQPQELGGLEFTYLQEAKFSGFQVSHDPGNSLIWLACGLFIFGVGTVLYFPLRQVWALVTPGPDGGSRIVLRSGSARSSGTDFAQLVSSLKTELGSRDRTEA